MTQKKEERIRHPMLRSAIATLISDWGLIEALAEIEDQLVEIKEQRAKEEDRLGSAEANLLSLKIREAKNHAIDSGMW